jgi:TetR/AcrR family transcriptional regulator, repressor for uid operon
MIVRIFGERSFSFLCGPSVNFDQSHDTEWEMPVATEAGRGVRAGKREAQVNRILEAARICFVQSGFRGASMHDICREAGMSPGALYRYFPSKEALIEAIAEHDRINDLRNLAQIGAGPTLIDGFVNSVMNHFKDHHARGMGPLFTEIRAESMRNETVAACCKKTEGEFINLFNAFLTQAKASGQINPVAKIDSILPIMMALGEGIMISDVIGQGVDAEDVEEILRAMAEAILRPNHESQSNA